jgi:hypothetical protein
MSKITKASKSSGLVNYILDEKKDALIIAIEGLRDSGKEAMIADFETQASFNDRVGKKFGHISLSFLKDDLEKLDDETMAKIAEEYLSEMGITNTQFLIARHFDKEHPHCHICFNRINNEGKTISDSNEHFRSAEVCKKLKLKYDLTFSEGKMNVNRDRLRGKQVLKYEIYDAITECLPKCKNWQDFEKNLNQRGIELRFKNKGSTEKIEGVVFSKNGQLFSGSKIDKSFSFGNLNKRFSPKQEQSVSQSVSQSVRSVAMPVVSVLPKAVSVVGKIGGGFKSTGTSMFAGAGSSAPPPDEKKRKKKKPKKGITYY